MIYFLLLLNDIVECDRVNFIEKFLLFIKKKIRLLAQIYL